MHSRTVRFLPVALAVLVILVAAIGVTAAPQQKEEEPRYPAMGSGHYILEVRDNGQFVTLEDKSRWEIEERDRYVTVDWQAMESMAVRYAGGTDAFKYQVVNTDRDEGAAARWIRPR
jgi:hypothetical protein